MIDIAFYLVTKDIARRTGLVGERYIAPDGRYILDNKDLSRIRLSTDEYINGLQGVEKITKEEAKTLIAQGGYRMIENTDNTEVIAATNEEENITNKEEETEE